MYWILFAAILQGLRRLVDPSAALPIVWACAFVPIRTGLPTLRITKAKGSP